MKVEFTRSRGRVDKLGFKERSEDREKESLILDPMGRGNNLKWVLGGK